MEFDLIPGDPRLALKEDLLSKDWQDAIAGDIRGLRTSFLFYEFLTRCQNYDFVLFDLGSSLGSINRSVLLGSDFFVSPMSIDIFSLRAIENISIALLEWRRRLKTGIGQVDRTLRADTPKGRPFDIKFSGYVAQQYIQKRQQRGISAPLQPMKNVMKRIPRTINTFFVAKPDVKVTKYEIGTIPNLYSLIPMAQTAHKPIFSLKAKDGVRGAHFNRVRDSYNIFSYVTSQLLKNVAELSK